MEYQQRLATIKKVMTTRPYSFYFAIIFLTYLAINVLVNKVYVTAMTLFSFRLSVVIPLVTFTLLVPALVALSINLIILRLRELRRMSRTSGLTAAGSFGGILAGACPGCFVGLFPAFVGLFGVTATLGSLPLLGFEIQIASATLLIAGILLLTRKTECRVEFSGKAPNQDGERQTERLSDKRV